MSFLSFLVPLSYGFSAYATTHLELPISVNGNRVLKGSPQYDEIIKTISGHHIKEELQPFFVKHGIRQDLIVLEKLAQEQLAAMGTNSFTQGQAAIQIGPKLYKLDKEMCVWAIKHEISHLKNNDAFNCCLITAICSFAAALFSTFSLFSVPAMMLTWTVAKITFIMLSQYCERRADSFAIAESTDEELKGARRYCQNNLNVNLQLREATAWTRIRISPTGQDRLSFLHPTYASRLRKVEKELKRRNVTFDEIEKDKVFQLERRFYRNTVKATLGDTKYREWKAAAKQEATAS